MAGRCARAVGGSVVMVALVSLSWATPSAAHAADASWDSPVRIVHAVTGVDEVPGQPQPELSLPEQEFVAGTVYTLFFLQRSPGTFDVSVDVEFVGESDSYEPDCPLPSSASLPTTPAASSAAPSTTTDESSADPTLMPTAVPAGGAGPGSGGGDPWLATLAVTAVAGAAVGGAAIARALASRHPRSR